MKLFVDGEIYKDRHGCWPISFYFGETHGCRRIIYKNINNSHKKSSKEIIHEHYENKNNGIANFQKIIFKFFNILKYVNDVLNKMIELNESTQKNIYIILKEKIKFFSNIVI